MPTTKMFTHFADDGGFEEFELSVRVSKLELENLSLTPDLLELELKQIFTPRNKPYEVVTDGIKEMFTINDDINAMYVDHLVINLEEGRSILEIVLFLSKYCGWDRIKKQMDDYVRKLERGSNGKQEETNRN